MAVDASTLDMLLQSGQITPDQHAQFQGMLNPIAPAAPAPSLVGTDLTPTPQSMAGVGGVPLANAGAPLSPFDIQAPLLPGTTAPTMVNGAAKHDVQDGTAADATGGGTGLTSMRGPRGPINLHGTETTDTTKQMGDTAKRDVNKMRESGEKLAVAQMDALTAETELNSQKNNDELAAMTASHDEAMRERVAFEGKVQEKRERIAAIEEQYSNMEVDPKHAWGDGITSSKIMAAIGLTLGALGSAISGKDQQSGVVGILQKIVENDIRAQEHNIAKTGKSLEMARGGLKAFFDETKDMQTARDLELARGLTKIAKKYEAIANSTASPQIKAQAAKIYHDLDTRIAQITAPLDQKIHTSVEKDEQQAAKPMEASSDAVAKTLTDNVTGLAKVQDLREMIKEIKGNKQLYGIMQKGWSKIGRMDGEAAVIFQKTNDLLGAKVRALYGGQSSDSESKSVKKTAPSLLLSEEANMALLDSIEKDFATQIDAMTAGEYSRGKLPPDADAMYKAVTGADRKSRESLKTFTNDYFKANPDAGAKVPVGYGRR